MGQTDTAKGTRQFGCRLGDMWAGGQAKSLAHLAVSWGTQTSPHWRKQQKHHQCVRNVLVLWERFYSPKRIKCHGCSLIRGDPSMSLGMCDSLSELTPLQSHSHCCKQLVLHPNQSVILYPTLHRDNSALELLSPCAATLFIHIFTAMCIFHLGQSQGVTEGREYLLRIWDLFANFDFPFCPGEGKKGHIPVPP